MKRLDMKKKLLIVDDDKFIISIIIDKLKDYEDLEILTAGSYKDGIKCISNNKNTISAAIIDLNLPDCNDGDMANYTLAKKIPTVILTGKYDRSMKDKLLQYTTLDFIVKDGKKGIKDSIFTIKRVLNNYDTNVLIVDDSKVQRSMLKQILLDMNLNVDLAGDGIEALDIIKNSEKKYSLVITDFNMPKMNGIELVSKLREEYNKDQLGIIAISSSEVSEIMTEFIKLGANDYINKAYSTTEVITRVNSILDLLDLFEENRQIAFRDFLTNLYNRRYFFKNGQDIFEKAKRSNKDVVIAIVDIDKFKDINDTYGHDIGDIALQKSAEMLKNSMRKSDLIARFGGEEFCILLENISYDDSEKIFEKMVRVFEKNIIKYNEFEINFTISIGVCYGLGTNLEEMIKDADKSLYESKKNGRNQVSIKRI
jgi:diguanylate cyclase (GGDEF)-like protein